MLGNAVDACLETLMQALGACVASWLALQQRHVLKVVHGCWCISNPVRSAAATVTALAHHSGHGVSPWLWLEYFGKLCLQAIGTQPRSSANCRIAEGVELLTAASCLA